MGPRSVDYSQTGFFPEHIVRYLEGDPELASFYHLPFHIDSFSQAIENKKKEKTDRELLVKVLLEQNSKAHDNSIRNIQMLADERTFTVCTGHQLCLFTGPLYYLYKLIGTINLAESLKAKYPGYNFVPVYWMASEDHDFEEINHAHLFGKKVEWGQDQATGTKPLPAGRIPTAGLKPVVEEVKNLLGEGAFAAELKQLLEDAYGKHDTLAAATRYLVNKLLGSYGLVILDADDARLKKRFSHVMRDELLNSSNHMPVMETIEQLKKKGVRVQVNPREINLFYLGAEGRQRIEKTGDAFKILNTELGFSREEMIGELDQHPERFSPNVVLRPLYQESILPDVAYVGGAGELSYWLEYKSMFEKQKVAFPILVLRNSVLYIDGNSRKKLDKMDLQAEELFADTEALVKKYISQHASAVLDFSKEEQQLKELYGTIRQKAENMDPTLKATAESEGQKALNGLKSLEQKLLKAEKQKQETTVNQLRKLKEKLFPGGALQERHDNFLPLYSQQGPAFLEKLKKELDPFHTKFLLLEE